MTDTAKSPGGERRPVAWAISGGARGMENQAIALAEAAGYEPQPVRIAAKAPWRWLPERGWRLWGDVPRRLSEASTPLAPPYPDLVVGCGRLAVAAAIHVRRISKGSTFVVQCQDPRVPPSNFDLIVPPEHDHVPAAPNVFPIVGSPNLALPWRLDHAADLWRETFEDMPRPLIAVAIGGPNRAYRMGTPELDALFRHLAAIREATGASFAITTSRRTGAENEARVKRAAEQLGAWLWDGEGPSPILGLYALSDAVVVTEDSVNMAGEAAAAGRPVYIAPLEGHSEKFTHFHDSLRARGIARTLTNRFETWTYPPLRETQRAAEAIRTRMAERGFTLPPPRG